MKKPLTLFLDLDGVINDHQLHSNGYCCTKFSAVKHLNKIIDEFDPNIIIHSAWRYLVLNKHMTIDGFTAMLATHGLKVYRNVLKKIEKTRIMDVTRYDVGEGSLEDRADQILKRSPGYAWVAIDDLELPLPEKHFVRTYGHKGFDANCASELRSKIWNLQKQYDLLNTQIKEHQWTIDNGFRCIECGYVANEEESKFLHSCHWSVFSADIHHSAHVPRANAL